MLEAVKVALDPTPRQERLLESHAGAARFAYNNGLAHVKDVLERGDTPEWSYYALRRWWNQAKNGLAVDETTGEPWWPENSKEAYNSGLESLADALRNFSKSRKGRRKGRRMGFPRFKSKDKAVPRFAYTTGSFGLIDCDPHALRLPKIGRVHCMENVSKRVNGAKVLRMSVSKRGGRWQASLTVERADRPIPSPPERRERRHRLGCEGARHIVGRHRDTQPARTQIEPQTVEESPTESEPQTERLQPPPQGGSAGRPTIRTGGEPAFGRAQQDHRHARPYLRGHQHRGLERGGHGGKPRARPIDSGCRVRGVPTPTDLQDRTHRREASRHRPLVSKLEDLLELRDGESQAPLSERVYHCGKCGLDMDRDLNAAINHQVVGSAPETLNARGGSVRQAHPKGGTMRHPAKREPSGGESRVSLGAGLGNEAMQMTSL